MNAINYSLPGELLDLESIQVDLVHDHQSAARDGLKDLIAAMQVSGQFDMAFRTEIIRQLSLAQEFVSGETRDPKRASRRVHRVTRAIFNMVRSNYTASLKTCFPPEAVHCQVQVGGKIVIDEDIPPDA